MTLLKPTFGGKVESPKMPADILGRMAQRIEDGLLMRGYHMRANYKVYDQQDDVLRFRADNWSTAINVGLNDVTLRKVSATRVEFSVTYWRWFAYCMALASVIALGLLFMALLMPMSRFSSGQLACFLGSVLFWCMLWPWVLVVMHKRAARKCLERIINEEVERATEVAEGESSMT